MTPLTPPAASVCGDEVNTSFVAVTHTVTCVALLVWAEDVHERNAAVTR